MKDLDNAIARIQHEKEFGTEPGLCQAVTNFLRATAFLLEPKKNNSDIGLEVASKYIQDALTAAGWGELSSYKMVKSENMTLCPVKDDREPEVIELETQLQNALGSDAVTVNRKEYGIEVERNGLDAQFSDDELTSQCPRLQYL